MWRVIVYCFLMSLMSRYAAVHITEKGPIVLSEGQTFSLVCRGEGPLTWYPPIGSRRKSITNPTRKSIFEVKAATVDDSGLYKCMDYGNRQFTEKILVNIVSHNESYVTFLEERELNTIEVNERNPNATFKAMYNSTPNAVFSWYGPNGKEIKSNKKYYINKHGAYYDLCIYNSTPDDEGVYLLLGRAGNKEAQQKFTLIFADLPLVTITARYELFIYKESYTITCEIKSYPLANITWTFINCTDYSACNENETTLKVEYLQEKYYNSNISLKALTSGMLQCKACNRKGCIKKLMPFFISDTADVFSITDPNLTIEGESVTLQCSGSIYNLTGITWMWKPINGSEFMEIKHKKGISFTESNSSFSIKSELNIKQVSYKEHRGEYFCRAKLVAENSYLFSDAKHLIIKQRIKPFFNNSYQEPNAIYIGNKTELNCVFSGLPKPEINWFKDEKKLNPKVKNSRTFFNNENQIIVITDIKTEDTGIYKCTVKNSAGSIERSFNINIIQDGKSAASNTKAIVIAVITVFVILLAVVAYLIWRIRKKKNSVKILTAEVTAFYEGVLLTIDPDLAIDEQADLLPFIKDFEFPKEKLKFGKQLASGAFREVMMAEAVDLKGNEKSTTVAVKMVKSSSDITHLKALMTELKILIYVGQHLNILNLLGACTTRLIHKELFLIFEYCHFGNVHSYLQLHRETFINQVDPVNDTIDFTIGSDMNTQSTKKEISSKPHGESNVVFDNSTSQLLILDSTVSAETSTSRTAHGHRNTDVVNQRWSVNYTPDFEEELPILLNTKTLLCWSYQVAMGMEYLSNLMIVHADLAARNILLAENNVVKISDFGLARNLYKNAHSKSGKDSKPMKWMAIESIQDRIYSTKSDVWSFGIVLWEFFTLGNTPYPGMEVNEEFKKKLNNGYRMPKPEFSTHDMYRVMQGCWKDKPEARPHFTDLVHRIGETLDEESKKHYVEMNSPYMEHNAKIKDNIKNYIEIINDNNQNHNQTDLEGNQ